MKIFKRLFAAFYFILIRQRKVKSLRHLSLGGTEDFGAMCFVLFVQFIILATIFYLLKMIFRFSTPAFPKGLFNLPKIIALIVLGIWLYAGNKYFLSNRDRRNSFIETFRSLNSKQKYKWNLVAIFFLLTPIYLIIYSLLKYKFSL